jgi:hypothetical protein
MSNLIDQMKNNTSISKFLEYVLLQQSLSAYAIKVWNLQRLRYNFLTFNPTISSHMLLINNQT